MKSDWKKNVYKSTYEAKNVFDLSYESMLLKSCNAVGTFSIERNLHEACYFFMSGRKMDQV